MSEIATLSITVHGHGRSLPPMLPRPTISAATFAFFRGLLLFSMQVPLVINVQASLRLSAHYGVKSINFTP